MLLRKVIIIIYLFCTFCAFARELNVEFDDEEKIRWNGLLIYPGTKWCGAGNISENYDDLGEHAETDKCCREHDFCPDFIEGFGTKHELQNPTFYTRLNCKCDRVFHKCLKGVNTKESNSLGMIYFDILNTKCYRLDYPIVECIDQTTTPFPKCKEYKLDKSGKKIYQWFDVPSFSANAMDRKFKF